MDDSKTVGDFLKETIAKTGENVVIRRFKRIELGVND
jgi:translation elongation factor EF-Ts